MKSKLNRYRLSEVISYLEVKLLEDSNTYEEEQMYIEYINKGSVNKKVHKVALKSLINEMNAENDFKIK